MSILIVDSDPSSSQTLGNILEKAGYVDVTILQDPWQVLAQFNTLKPDLILLSLNLPKLNGFQLMAALEPMIGQNYLPIVVLLGDEHQQTKEQAMNSGASDFLKKPYDLFEVKVRVKKALETRRLHRQYSQSQHVFKTRIEQKDAQLEGAYYEMITRLAVIAEYRDPKASEHVWRVAQNAYLIALEMGFSIGKAEVFMRAARLHDVGKVAIPDHILYKPGSLTPKEFETIKTHSEIGAQLLSGGQSPMIKLAASIALTHHERWDGAGYPRRLVGKAIPIEGRIVAIADTFDAMTSDRQHKKALGVSEAINEIERQSGKQFDPEVVEAFMRLYEKGTLVLPQAKENAEAS
jgi:putative two-component system response regulator